MDSKNLQEERKSNLVLENRKTLSLTGVLEVMSFDEQQINLSTSLGGLNITGKSLKVNKLDVQNGDVVITGYVKSIVYCNDKPKKKLKLFKGKENK
ncbi:MAG: sporulation protein YabP [Sarcina sp.]